MAKVLDFLSGCYTALVLGIIIFVGMHVYNMETEQMILMDKVVLTVLFKDESEGKWSSADGWLFDELEDRLIVRNEDTAERIVFFNTTLDGYKVQKIKAGD